MFTYKVPKKETFEVEIKLKDDVYVGKGNVQDLKMNVEKDFNDFEHPYMTTNFDSYDDYFNKSKNIKIEFEIDKLTLKKDEQNNNIGFKQLPNEIIEFEGNVYSYKLTKPLRLFWNRSKDKSYTVANNEIGILCSFYEDHLMHLLKKGEFESFLQKQIGITFENILNYRSKNHPYVPKNDVEHLNDVPHYNLIHEQYRQIARSMVKKMELIEKENDQSESVGYENYPQGY